jgi:hypothetical protein
MKGYLFVATGDQYLREAEFSANSLLQHSPNLPIALITDQKSFQSDCFDQIIYIDFPNLEKNKKMAYATKILGMINSPYEKTIFIDTDTFFCDHTNELFDVLDYFDLMICHDYQEHTFALVNGTEMKGYHTYNTGVIAFKKSKIVGDFLESWLTIFNEKIDSYWSDQPAFMEALLYANIKTYSLQTIYNFRFNQYLPISNGKVKILHGRHPNMESIGTILNAHNHHRSWDPRDWKCRSWEDKPSLKESVRRLIK